MKTKRFEGAPARLRNPERVNRLEIARVVDLCLGGGRINTVLDVGTGTGLFAEEFLRRGLDVAGVDVNPEMLAIARQMVPEGRFQVAPAEALPHPDDLFDLAFLGLVLHESDDPLRALQEAARVAQERVCVLEWPHREQSFGPALGDRLEPGILSELFQKAGFRKWELVELAHTDLYTLSKQAEKKDP